MKCMNAITERQGDEVCLIQSCSAMATLTASLEQWEVILLGGLAGRLDQTIHTLSYLHKLRKDKSKRVFAVTDDNLGWVLDSVMLYTLNSPIHRKC